MVFILDIGNTAIKIAVVDHLKVYDLYRSTAHDFQDSFAQIRKKYPAVKEIVWCQVGPFPITLREKIEKTHSIFELRNDCIVPFENNYKSATLGIDRIALVAGVEPNTAIRQSTLIVSMGTCITYDFIDADNVYHGGAISPGINLRYSSLHNFTKNLPLLKAEKQETFLGDSTESAIHNGVLNGILQEIKGTRKQYKSLDTNLNCILTGGDAHVLQAELKRRFFVHPFLMLHGIYKLYILNN